LRNEVFVLPSHCFACGVPLAGSWTRHKDDCPIKKSIEEFTEQLRADQENIELAVRPARVPPLGEDDGQV
jgi:DNA-directed RNA polymerase subunit N (RpoN/RPB10)